MKRSLELFPMKYLPPTLGMIWYVILFPGNPTPDGVRSLRFAQAGVIDSWFSIPYGLILYFVTFAGQTIALLVALQGVSLYLAVSKFLSCLVSNVIRYRILSIISVLPIFWIFSFTLYHDVFFCAGVILLVSLAISNSGKHRYTPVNKLFKLQLLFASFLLSMRLNALIWVFVLLIASTFFNKLQTSTRFNLRTIQVSLLQILVISTIALGSKSFIPTTQENGTSIALHIFVADIKCALYNEKLSTTSKKELFGSDFAEQMLKSNSSKSGCGTIDGIFEDSIGQEIENRDSWKVIRLWMRELGRNPLNIISTHMDRIWIAFPQYFFPPYKEVNFDIELLPNPPKSELASTVFLSVYDLDTDVLENRESNIGFGLIQKYVGLFNQLSLILGTPIGLFLLIAIALQTKRFTSTMFKPTKDPLFWVVGFLYLISSISMLAASPAPDIRFFYAILILQYIYLIRVIIYKTEGEV